MLDINLTEGDWFEGLHHSQRQSLEALLAKSNNEEEAGEIWLSRFGSGTTAGFGTLNNINNFYVNLRHEFIKFVCEESAYSEERSQAAELWKSQGKVGLVSFVAVTLAHPLGMAAAAITPVVALLFSLVAKFGVKAFCATCASKVDNQNPPSTTSE